MRIAVDVQEADFDLTRESLWLREGNTSVGAIACFVGLARDFSEQPQVQALYLEHYPGMTEKSLEDIARQAGERWSLQGVRIIHRVGELRAGDQIVLVAVSSVHRGEAFAACEFIMDYLKVKAPFWKKEITATGEHWVQARETDQQRAEHWRDAGQSD